MPERSETPLLRHAPAKVHGRYFVRPARSRSDDLWLVGFHGQGQTADQFLEYLESIPEAEGWLVASIQGLNRHYMGRRQAIVASWMTSQDRELAIADNVRWIDTVLDRLEQEFGAPRAIVFAGFSQGVAMAYRAARLCARHCAAILAVCGDVPPELKGATSDDWPMVLAATGAGDGWYSPDRLAADFEFLHGRSVDARMFVFEGRHEWTKELAQQAGEFLNRVARAASTQRPS